MDFASEDITGVCTHTSEKALTEVCNSLYIILHRLFIYAMQWIQRHSFKQFHFVEKNF